MKKYYTRVCNFHYGINSKNLVKKKKALPLNNNLEISFDHIEILSRNSKKKIHIKEIKKFVFLFMIVWFCNFVWHKIH